MPGLEETLIVLILLTTSQIPHKQVDLNEKRRWKEHCLAME